MWVNDRHKSVQKSLSCETETRTEIYSDLSRIKTLITSQILLHASNNSNEIMKFPPLTAKIVKKKQPFDLIPFYQKSESQ